MCFGVDIITEYIEYIYRTLRYYVCIKTEYIGQNAV